MNMSKLVVGVFAVILFVFAAASLRFSNSASPAAQFAAQPQTSHVMMADGTDPVPRPWRGLAA